MRKLIGLLSLIITVVFIIAAQPGVCQAEARQVLTRAKQKVAAEFDRLDAGLRQAARELSTTGLTGDNARSILAKLCSDFDYAVDCAAVDSQGKMVTIEPASFKQFEGKDISAQEQVQRIRKTGQPVLSRVFRAVEGYPAADAEYPVAAPDGRKLGSVSILFPPEKLLSKIIIPLVQGTPVDIWAMEKEGLILYDTDTPQIGLNLFTSPLYQPYLGLIRLGRRIAAQPAGKGFYKFRGGSSPKIVKKNASWQSVSLYGTEWRLVAIHVEYKSPAQKTGIAVPAGTMERQLTSLTTKNSLIKALAGEDSAGEMQLFKEFFNNAPGIYSVQWIDEKGINRYGYPRENSLTDYDYNARRTANDQDILKILNERQPSVYETDLIEGRRGIFTFRPVFQKGRYLGMVYFIRLKD